MTKIIDDRIRMIRAFQEIQKVMSRNVVTLIEFEDIDAICREAIAPQKNVWETGDPVNEK